MIDKGRAKHLLLIVCIIGLCILVAGISGRIIMGKITEEIMSSEFVGSMDESIPGVRDLLNRSMGRLTIKLTVSLIRNDPSGFVRAVKEVMQSIGSLADSSGIGNLVLSPLFGEAALEAFQMGRNQLVESAGAYMPLLQFAAYYHELLLIGGIIAGVSLLLWLLIGGKVSDIKSVQTLLIIAVALIVVVFIMTIIMLNNMSSRPGGDPPTATQEHLDDACTHSHTTLLNDRVATCTEKGYSGDIYCEDCHTMIQQGEDIPFADHQYENGVCKQCGWRIPGLYVDNNLMFTWAQLIENSYITLNGNSIHSVLNTLHGDLVVEEGFDVDSEAFYESSLGTVFMPATYTRINSSAFYGANISSIVFYGKVDWIGEAAFKQSGIKRISIPDGVISIPDGCFSDCELLEEVQLPQSIESLEGYAFANCKMLKRIYLPDGLKTIGGFCFCGSGLKSITIPESVTEIGNSCFAACMSLQTVDMSRSAVVKLNKSVFLSCSDLVRVDLPGGLVEIDAAFSEDNPIEYLILPETTRSVNLGSNYRYPIASLKWVVWPASLLDASGFECATNLETVYYSGSEYQWNLVTGKEYSRPFESNKDIFENVRIIYNATEDQWSGRRTLEYSPTDASLINDSSEQTSVPIAIITPEPIATPFIPAESAYHSETVQQEFAFEPVESVMLDTSASGIVPVFNMSEPDFQNEAYALLDAAQNWDRNTVPKYVSDIPLIPNNTSQRTNGQISFDGSRFHMYIDKVFDVPYIEGSIQFGDYSADSTSDYRDYSAYLIRDDSVPEGSVWYTEVLSDETRCASYFYVYGLLSYEMTLPDVWIRFVEFVNDKVDVPFNNEISVVTGRGSIWIYPSSEEQGYQGRVIKLHINTENYSLRVVYSALDGHLVDFSYEPAAGDNETAIQRIFNRSIGQLEADYKNTMTAATHWTESTAPRNISDISLLPENILHFAKTSIKYDGSAYMVRFESGMKVDYYIGSLFSADIDMSLFQDANERGTNIYRTADCAKGTFHYVNMDRTFYFTSDYIDCIYCRESAMDSGEANGRGEQIDINGKYGNITYWVVDDTACIIFYNSSWEELCFLTYSAINGSLVDFTTHR